MWLRSEDQWTDASHKSNCFVSNCQIIYYNFLYILFYEKNLKNLVCGAFLREEKLNMISDR